MNKVIKIENIKKSYGEIIAVNNVSYSVTKGEMFGLVGPDGAGKTTTIRIMCGLLNPDFGVINILNMDVTKNHKEVQNNIGYLSQRFSLYNDLTVDENIEFFADIHGVTNLKTRRDELLAFTRLTPFKNRLAENLSGGMKQKLALACSLIHKPKILFLDEPTTGVDPVSRRDFWKILSDLQREGITIFMTTPYLDEAERCNRVALMHNGEIISIDTPKKIKDSINKKTLEIISDDIRLSYKILSTGGIESQIFGDRINVMINNYDVEFPAIKKLLSANNIKILSSKVMQPSLENAFIHLIKTSPSGNNQLVQKGVK